jgi:uncharacterized protein YecE (DUF72 family)
MPARKHCRALIFSDNVPAGHMNLDLIATATPEDLFGEGAERIPPNVYLGTSTWAFPAWKGLLYRRDYRSERDFTQRSLEEYATVPWFRTVCIDSLFYNPPKPETMRRYAEQTPGSFRWVSKVWERLTILRYPKHARYGALAGQDNPDFLNVELLKEKVLRAYEEPGVLERSGPFIFQFAPFSPSVMPYGEFTDRLAEFLRTLPKGLMYGVEVRNREVLTGRYFQALNESGVTHVFNHWNSMASLKEQMVSAAEVGGLTADFYVARLLTPRGVSYEGAAKMFEPYDKVLRPSPEMRGDVVRLIRRAISTGKKVFVTANNKAEGNSPLTMVTLAKLVVADAAAGNK